MATQIVRDVKLLMVAVIALTVTAHPQSVNATRVKIPFQFNIGQQSFPAGDYSVIQPEQHVLVLRNSDGRRIAQLLTQAIDSNSPADQSKLTFRLSDGQYNLSEVWQQDSVSGARLPMPKPRVKMAKRDSGEEQTSRNGQP